MKRNIILDTGPLVALIDGADRDHEWSVQQWKDIEPPMFTCESVISEAFFLLQQIDGADAVLQLLSLNAIQIEFHLEEHVKSVQGLIRKYARVPMSVADACLVRMTELIPESAVLTLDGDFRIYRKHGRQVIPLIAPVRTK